jgi:hypothetical protein
MPVKDTWVVPAKEGWRLIFIGRYYKNFDTKQEAKEAEKNVLNILDTKGYAEAEIRYIGTGYFKLLEGD